jgi:hypothetical protein
MENFIKHIFPSIVGFLNFVYCKLPNNGDLLSLK